MSTNDKTLGYEPAFPIISEGYGGLTKREYFAACALQSAITLPWACGDTRGAAEAAVIFADALIEALNAREGEG
jgi:hypothetical protein